MRTFEPLDTTKIHNPNIIIGKNDQVIPADYQRAFCQRHGWSCMETDWGHRVEDVSLILSLINAD